MQDIETFQKLHKDFDCKSDLGKKEEKVWHCEYCEAKGDEECEEECYCGDCLDNHEPDCGCEGCVERAVEFQESMRDAYD